MRALIRTRIIGDPQLKALGVTSAGTLAGQVDTPTARPFLNLIWGDTSPGQSVVSRRLLTIWVHDVPNDYSRIDSIILRLKAVLSAIEAERGSSGWVSLVEWQGDSGDLNDAGHGTIVRTSTFRIIGSGQ